MKLLKEMRKSLQPTQMAQAGILLPDPQADSLRRITKGNLPYFLKEYFIELQKLKQYWYYTDRSVDQNKKNKKYLHIVSTLQK